MALRYKLTFFNFPKSEKDNALCDNHSPYDGYLLGAFGSGLVVENVAPFEMGLSIVSKIEIADTTVFSSHNFPYNYMVVETSSTKWFYWVTSVRRSSNQVAYISASLDTLNTFKTAILTNITDNRTYINREHVDRFGKTSGGVIYPIIDEIDEGFTLNQYKKEDFIINYKNFSYNNINIFGIANARRVNIEVPYTFWAKDPTAEYPAETVINRQYVQPALQIALAFDKPMDVYKPDGTTKVGGINRGHIPPRKGNYYNQYDHYMDNTNWYAWAGEINEYFDYWGTTKITDIDVSVETLIKIKALPYPPIEMSYANNRIVLGVAGNEHYDYIRTPSGAGEDNWGDASETAYHGIVLTIKDGVSAFGWFPWVSVRANSPLNDDVLDYHMTGTPSVTQIHTNAFTDPKCFHSSFYTVKYAYGKNYFELRLEDIITSANNYINIDTRLSYSSDLNMIARIYPDNGWKKQIDDYAGVFVLDDSLEVPLISDAYVSYMRNGYNYDQELHQQEFAKNVVTGAATVGMTALTATMSSNPYTLPIAVASAAVLAAIKIGFTEANFGVSQEKKLSMLSAQTPSITKGDRMLSFDIVQNRIHEMHYAPLDEEKEKLNKLFHIYGYLRNLYKSANISTRYWFNFVQCVPHTLSGVPNYAQDDVFRKLSDGVTIYHSHLLGGSTTPTYDFEQHYENWEVSLL